jgi:hypothetical protein
MFPFFSLLNISAKKAEYMSENQCLLRSLKSQSAVSKLINFQYSLHGQHVGIKVAHSRRCQRNDNGVDCFSKSYLLL